MEVSPHPNDVAPLGDRWRGLDEQLAAALERLGFRRPTASQRWAVPLLMSKKDAWGEGGVEVFLGLFIMFFSCFFDVFLMDGDGLCVELFDLLQAF